MSVVKLIQGGVYWTAHVDSQSENEEDDKSEFAHAAMDSCHGHEFPFPLVRTP